MGILNVTPDSFSENGLNFDISTAIDAGRRMLGEGADILDIGGESTRPGAMPVSHDEELRRVLPVIESLVNTGARISVDTRHAKVARESLKAGAMIVNDVSGLADPEMLGVCVSAQATLCVMHMQGTPQDMQVNPTYDDVVGEVLQFLLTQAEFAKSAGLFHENIWIDPGIGFGKTPEQNLQLLHQLHRFVKTGYPVLLGISRKSSISAFAGGVPVSERLPGTLAAQVLGQASGVQIIRAHDVREARQAIDVAAVILKPSLFSIRPA